MLDDYAFLVFGLIELYQSTAEPRWLAAAIELTDAMISNFGDPDAGAFFFTAADSEELLIRADRLLGSNTTSPAVMQGDLANHPVWELMQYVQQAGKSGELSVRGSRVGSGRLRAIDGRVLSARFGELEGRDALLAIHAAPRWVDLDRLWARLGPVGRALAFAGTLALLLSWRVPEAQPFIYFRF